LFFSELKSLARLWPEFASEPKTCLYGAEASHAKPHPTKSQRNCYVQKRDPAFIPKVTFSEAPPMGTGSIRPIRVSCCIHAPRDCSTFLPITSFGDHRTCTSVPCLGISDLRPCQLKSRGGVFPVKKRISFVTLFLAAVALLSVNCGTSDYIESLTLTSNGANAGGFYNLVGADGTLQLVVTANYHSGKTIVVTNNSTWNVTTICCDQNGDQLPAYGPTTVPISPTGLMTAVESLCTWTDQYDPTSTPPGYANPPEWEYTGYYQVTATYRNFTSQPVAIGVGSQTSTTSPIGGCGPS
jgi:hypothetical protein